METDSNSYRDALVEIANIASGATTRTSRTPEVNDETDGCRIISLPERLQANAAELASSINPVNAPLLQFASGLIEEPQRLTLLTAKYWGPAPRTLTVSFMESTPNDLATRILGHMNAWTRTVDIRFALTNNVGDVRISRGPGGYYSYLGTDIKLVPRNRQTMNLQNFTMSTSESEYKRVVRHETGHTLGFPHEHMRKALVNRIDPQKAYDYFRITYGWDKATVDAQVLTPLDSRTIIGTPADQDSIMCYQLPGSITKDGKPIRGGKDINQTDYTFAGRIYPKAHHLAEGGTEEEKETGLDALDVLAAADLDWDPAEDVEDVDVLA